MDLQFYCEDMFALGKCVSVAMAQPFLSSKLVVQSKSKKVGSCFC